MSQSKINRIIPSDLKDRLEGIFLKLKPDEEFEIMFFNYSKDAGNVMSIQQYINIKDYMTFKADKYKKFTLKVTHTLDVIYRDPAKDFTAFRITVDGLSNINTSLNALSLRKNHIIYRALLAKYINDTDGFSLMKKTKDMERTFNIDELKFRARLSLEENVSEFEIDEIKKISEELRFNIDFRYKQRISLVFYDKDNVKMSVDLTKSKTSKNINRLEATIPRFELEIEAMTTKKPPTKKELDMLYSEISNVVCVLNQNPIITTTSMVKNVLEGYAKLLNLKLNRLTNLYGRQPHSLEIQHIVDKLPNKYCVTDKADGERANLMIYEKRVYIITNVLVVHDTGIDVSSKHNNTILDGEYIFLPKYNRCLFMAFDGLVVNGIDIRDEVSFLKRLEHIDGLISDAFTTREQPGYKFKSYGGVQNTKLIEKFYNNEINQFLTAMNHDVMLEKKFVMVRRKFFIPVTGAKDNEIFKYTTLLWNAYIRNSIVEPLYHLDGTVFHPLQQKYTTDNKQIRFYEYKMKPQDKNSIDFYAIYERDPETNKILTFYDNSSSDILNKPFRILNLHVGQTIRGQEQPVLFQQDKEHYIAHIYLVDNEVRDIDGRIIQDKTVIECYYNVDPEVNAKFRWIPMRTRYDKTETVMRYGRKYGNYITSANQVWRSIVNPITVDDFVKLGHDSTYESYRATLKSKIDHSLIVAEQKQDVYYQKRTNLGKPMRQFNNWIKSILIYTYGHPMYTQKQMRFLDIGCGRGGDILKYYHAKASEVVGIDVDPNGINSAVDGAISRYNFDKKKHPNFPRMSFIHAYPTIPLHASNQLKHIINTTDRNRDLLKKFFPDDKKHIKKFDRISCQFVLHYILENEIAWKNFCDNINEYLNPGGIAIFTCFDATRIVKLLGDKKSVKFEYTDTNGTKNTFAEIVNRYGKIEEGETIGLGRPIDFYNAMISMDESTYNTEYLVDPKFLIKEFKERCNMRILDTSTFDDFYEINKSYFQHCVEYEDDPGDKKFLMNVREFYNQTNEVNKVSFKLNKLYRYYVFMKEPEHHQKGGMTIIPRFYQLPDSLILKEMENNESSLYQSIKILLGNPTFIKPFLDVEKDDIVLTDLFNKEKISIWILNCRNLQIDRLGKSDRICLVLNNNGNYSPIVKISDDIEIKILKLSDPVLAMIRS
jgi:SAM-dependent methyltransferase